ncbi:unnamed protein product [Prorocentrum cordatum]|uniref:Uncharacterized protein n=1 Tax=Prorocentrum cordatum TaxID=2364126 RepID=A0ABN9Y0M4_9DINO|nr:unnamed protein product [Polarella glacialis]
MGEIVPADRPERALYPVWAILAAEAGQLARGLLADWWSPEPEAAVGGARPVVVCGGMGKHGARQPTDLVVREGPVRARPPQPWLCDAEAAWLRDLVPGGLIVTTFKDDEVAHERLLLWPVDRKKWCIMSPDGDAYIEPVARDEDWGVADTIPLDDVGTVPATFPMKVYRFREYPDADGLRELLWDGRAVARAELGREAPEVMTVLTPACERVPLEDFAPGLLVTRQTPGKVSPKAAAAASARRPAGPAAGPAGNDGRPPPAPPPAAPSDQLTAAAAADVAEGYIWVMAEPTGRHTIGTAIDGGAKVLVAPGGLDGLVKLDDRWRRIEGMAPEAVPGYTKHRSDELKESLGIAREGPGFDESDLRDRLGRALPEAPGGTATPPPTAAAEAAVETGDLRTMVIDYDGQGERYKSWKQVVQESSSETHESQHMGLAGTDRVAHEMRTLVESLWLAGTVDQVNIGGLLCIEAICRRMAGIVAAYANPAKPPWDLTRYYTGQLSAEDVVGPEMRSFVSRRAKEDRETGAGGLRGSPAECGAGGRVAATRGPRDLFPAPLLDVPPPLVAASTGAARARRREQLEIGPFPWTMPSGFFTSEFEDWHRAGAPDSAPSATAALKRMLRGHSPYEAGVTTTRVAPFKLDRISLPKSVRSCPYADEVAPQEVAKYLLDYQERMLRQVAPTDRRRVNEVFADPPGVDLLTADGFSRGEVVLLAGMTPRSPETVEYLSKLRLVVGTSDVANCFHCLKLRPEMSAYFGLPAVPAHVFGLEGTVAGGRHLGRTSPVYPVWAVLPMGFTWSLWFAQRINELQTLRGATIPLGVPLHDRGPPLKVLPSETAAGQAQHYVHVDNLGILRTRRYEVGEAISDLQRHFSDLGLVLHESAVTDGACKTLGVELLGEGLRSRVTSERWWLIRRAVEALLRRPKCSGWALEVVVGHSPTFASLANRGRLSVWHTVYAFMHKYGDGAGYLWDERQQELRALKELMLFLESDWTRPWNPMVFETDSSVEGMGIAKAMWDPEDVSAVGRVLERSRFKRSGSCGARESALEAAGFWRDMSGKWQVSDSDADPRTEGAWTLDSSCAEDAHGSLVARLTPRSAREERLELSPPAVRPSAAGRKRKQIDVCGCNEVDDSGSTTSEQSGGKRAVPKRAAALRKKARQRRSKFLSEAVTRAMDGGLNFLEASSVTKPVRERYEREVTEFIDYCDRPPALALRSAAQVDKALSQYFNYQFFQGHEAAKGEQALAGLVYSRPEFGKWGSQKLPNAWTYAAAAFANISSVKSCEAR